MNKLLKGVLLTLLAIGILVLSACGSSETANQNDELKIEPWSVMLGIRSEANGIGYKTVVISYQDGEYGLTDYDMGLMYLSTGHIQLLRGYDGRSTVESRIESGQYLTSDWSTVVWNRLGQAPGLVEIQAETGVYTKLQSHETIEAVVDGRVYLREDYHLSNSDGNDIIGYDIVSYALEEKRGNLVGIPLKTLLDENQVSQIMSAIDLEEEAIKGTNESDSGIVTKELLANREAWLPVRVKGGVFVQVPVDEVVTYKTSGETTKQTDHYINIGVQLDKDTKSDESVEDLLDYLVLDENLTIGINDKYQVVVRSPEGDRVVSQIGAFEKVLYMQSIDPSLYELEIAPEIAIAKGSWVLKHSAYKMVDESKLSALSQEALSIAKAEILARHGFTFEDEETQTYFDGQSWYKKLASPTVLNSIENANVIAIENALHDKTTKEIDLDFDGVVDQITLRGQGDEWLLTVNEDTKPIKRELNEHSLVIADLDESDGRMDILITVYGPLPQEYFTLVYQKGELELEMFESIEGVFYHDERGTIWQRRFLLDPFTHFAEIAWPSVEDRLFRTSSFHNVLLSFDAYTTPDKTDLITVQAGHSIEIIGSDGVSTLEFTTLEGLKGFIYLDQSGKINGIEMLLDEVLSNIK
ncbi:MULTISPECIES: YARHG domain-containing protein [unclassified Fusibacter]|uniref:YARHG domain-containing protein n=1 Tax=unclassified Fusibacter TaxID=2624464 RepID=UPI001012C96E|nr:MULTISPECIES: YARHG domain-containing protein [unclassified Fusibacter]MCK8060594.1 YARHG domain-containing protein [Fusibacter sp. A2]NPE22952.1 YARHG domain-containing protein [Fusibacter sp. A1]RXV60019.1 YARHG domain-containing protein [Fusibacter sp. A1]